MMLPYLVFFVVAGSIIGGYFALTVLPGFAPQVEASVPHVLAKAALAKM